MSGHKTNEDGGTDKMVEHTDVKYERAGHAENIELLGSLSGTHT